MNREVMNSQELAALLWISKNTLYNLLRKIKNARISESCVPIWIIVGRRRLGVNRRGVHGHLDLPSSL